MKRPRNSFSTIEIAPPKAAPLTPPPSNIAFILGFAMTIPSSHFGENDYGSPIALERRYQKSKASLNGATYKTKFSCVRNCLNKKRDTGGADAQIYIASLRKGETSKIYNNQHL